MTQQEGPCPSVAESSTLSALIAVNKAYSSTDAPSMLERMFRTARWPSRLAVLISSLAATGAIIWRSDFGVRIVAPLIVICFYWFKRDAFRHYYIRKRTATFLDTFTRRDQAIRYVMFRESVPDAIASDVSLLERLLRLLEQRQKVRHAGLITRHPAVTVLQALFLLFLGALVSKVADVSVTGTITVLFVIGMLILLAMQLGAVWRTREYRDEELAEFVLWLWAEASERSTREDTGPKPRA